MCLSDVLENGVFPSSVLSFLLDDVEFEAVRSNFNFDFRGGPFSIGGSWCGPSGPKLVYRNSESVPKFEVRMRLSGVYRMCVGWSLSVECSFLPLGDVEFEVARSRSNFVSRGGSCIIEKIRVVVQLVQNWFI